MNLQLDHYWKLIPFRNFFYNNTLSGFRFDSEPWSPCMSQVAISHRVRHCRRFHLPVLAGGLSKGTVPSWQRQRNLTVQRPSPLFGFVFGPPYPRGGMSTLSKITFSKLPILATTFLNNIVQWITWLGGRWRTQLTARRNVNCRIYEHRHFERILRNGARRLSMSGSGSVIHPSNSLLLALSSRWSFGYSVALRIVAL